MPDLRFDICLHARSLAPTVYRGRRLPPASRKGKSNTLAVPCVMHGKALPDVHRSCTSGHEACRILTFPNQDCLVNTLIDNELVADYVTINLQQC